MSNGSTSRRVSALLVVLIASASGSLLAGEPPENLSVRELIARLGTPGIEILDLRVDSEQDHENPRRGLDRAEAPTLFRAGHIPGALPFEVDDLLANRDPQESVREIVAALAHTGARTSDPIDEHAVLVIYGHDGDDPRVPGAADLLRRAGREVRSLAGGWRAWIEEKTAPKVEIIDALTLAQRLKVGNPELRRDQPSPHLPVFDLRPKDAARRRRLPGAAILDGDALDLALPAALVASWPEFDRTLDPIAFYCYGRTCIRSREAGITATRLGYRHILWFRDGMPGWEQAGLPVFGDEVPKALSESR